MRIGSGLWPSKGPILRQSKLVDCLRFRRDGTRLYIKKDAFSPVSRSYEGMAYFLKTVADCYGILSEMCSLGSA